MKVSAITPTGGRPEALALCHRWMDRQTRPLDEWVIVDDGGAEENTQAANLAAALGKVTGDVVLVIEDDDWYAPTYVEHMLDVERTADADLFGDGMACYYNVRTWRWAQLHNTHHASLCQTGFRAALIPTVASVLATSPAWIDLQLWKVAVERSRVHMPVLPEVVGIKGLPGRPGLGVGHRGSFGEPDVDGVLERWIGAEDAAAYRELMGRHP